MDKREGLSPPAVGGASLLVVFAVLCITVFALLSLSTVQANRRLAQAYVRSVEDYYAADCEAQAVLARLRAGEMPEGVVKDGDTYSYVCTVSDSCVLEVEVRIQEGECTVLRWQSVPSQTWEADTGSELWPGEGSRKEEH